MKRDILKNLVKAALTFSLIAGVGFAQYTKGNTVIAWSKYKLKPIPEVDGHEPGDRRESFEAYHTARNAKARLLLSSLFLTHYWTGHVTDVMQVNEFKSMGMIDKIKVGEKVSVGLVTISAARVKISVGHMKTFLGDVW